jgi:tRNA dimethylallyltransferase
LRVFLTPDREDLKRRIEARFEAMLAAGALDEVRALDVRGLDPMLPAMKAHGVPWLRRHLHGEMSLAEAAERGKSDTRRYTRRQVTWFRNQMPDWLWLAPGEALERIEVDLSPLAGRGEPRRSLAPDHPTQK